MKAVFMEMTALARHRASYLTDDDFKDLQEMLLGNPGKGDTISGPGGLRKVKWNDGNRGKGKRGGTRIIYYIYDEGARFWMFTIYDKDEMSDPARV